MSLKTQNTKLFSTVRLISVMMLFVMSFSFVLVACSPKKNGNQNQNVYYNVNFDTIGGSVIQSQKVKKGETASRPANPTHPNGYTFVDWYSDITLNNIFNFNTKINSDIKIYAKWESSQSQIFTVTLYANGGVFSNGEGQITKIADAGSLLSPETPTKAGSIFVGWYKDNGTFNDAFNFSTVTISANLSVYAKWEKNDVPEQILTVSFDANGGSNLSIASKEVTVGQSYGVLATVTPPSDKSFNGWYTQSSSGTLVTQGTTVNQSNDHTLYAHYGAKDDSSTSPDAAVNRFKKFLNKDTYEIFFPYRKGVSPWDGPDAEDFYSYDNLIAAIRMMSNFKMRLVRNANDIGDVGKIYVTDKTTGVETHVFTSVAFDSNSSALFEDIVDYGSFLADGDENTQKKELAAFLANISHESTGGGYSATTREWGLFFNQETGLTDDTIGWYTTNPLNPGEAIPHQNFPPNPQKSYHGRGPIQLSWNYNYGLFSSIFYQDKQKLLDDPNAVCRVGNGALAFATAIWFWMTPQGAKPSCHDVMTGVYVPTAQDIAAGRTVDTLGISWTIVIINGFYEANKDREYPSVGDRILFYEFFTGNAWHPNGSIPGITTTGIDADIKGDKLDTLGMQMYDW